MLDFLREVRITKRPNTLKQYTSRLEQFRAWLIERFGYDPEPAKLSRSLLLDFYEATAIGRSGRPLSDASRAPIISTVQGWWRWAWEHDDHGEWFPRPVSIPVRQPTPKLVAAPTWAEAAAAVHESWTSAAWRGRMATLCYFTGLRAHSQVAQLDWSDVDLARGELHLRPELGKTRSERSGRVLPLSPHLVSMMAGWGVREGSVVGMDAKRAGDDVARLVWERAGVRPEVWHRRPWHAYRKAFVTGLKAAGVDHNVVRYLVGHELDVTGGAYTDARALQLREAVAIVPPLEAQPDVVLLTGRRVSRGPVR